MKLSYEKPLVEIICFQMENYLMNNDPSMGSEYIPGEEGEAPPF